MCRIFLALSIALVLLYDPNAAWAENERITSFRSDVKVLEDGNILVTETIELVSQGQDIKRGIIRDFPLDYRDRYGNRVTVGFELLEVLRDGRSEPHFTKKSGRYIKIYIGQEDRMLQPGRHRYRISYRTTRQLGFFEEFDELYWNVTGNEWTFVIEKAEAYIQLPKGAPALQEAAYTGPDGAKGQDYTLSNEGAHVVFRTSRPLQPREGLTVAIAWPKGYVTEPDDMTKLGYVLDDNAALMAALIGFVVVFAYYFVAWLMVGRDPAGGSVIPRFKPPEGLSPAAARFLVKMGFDNKTFAAAMVSLAVKGRIEIEEEDNKYRLRQVNKTVKSASTGERRLASQLFRRRKSILLKKKNHKTIGKARDALKSFLRDEYETGYFKRNRIYFFGGLVPMLATLLTVTYFAGFAPETLFLSVWLTGWSVGCFMLLHRAIAMWRGAFATGLDLASLLGAVVITAFSVPFLGAEVFALVQLAALIGYLPTAVCFLMLLQAMGFFYWLKAPTRAGRTILDEIEGFKLYLSVAEKDRLEQLHGPEETPQLFEKYLPYALALDVENHWCERFSGILGAAGTAASNGRAYRPSWYHGNAWRSDGLSGLGQALGGSLAGAAGSSATAPGSSSGSGGGGSSGGGGGGGGGSGW